LKDGMVNRNPVQRKDMTGLADTYSVGV